MCHTYSRGALLAYSAGLLVFGTIQTNLGFVDIKRSIWNIIFRLGSVGITANAIGAWNRVSGVTAGDAEIVNRLTVWRQTSTAILSAPWTGWGHDEFGRIFHNWFQVGLIGNHYETPANGWLLLLFSHGLVVWSCGLVGLVWLCTKALVGSGKDTPEQAAVACSIASIVAFSVGNVFSAVSADLTTVLPFVVSVGILIYHTAKSPGFRIALSEFVLMAVGVVVATALSFACLKMLSCQSTWRVSKRGDWITMSRVGAPSHGRGRKMTILTDQDVCGSYAGEFVRLFADRLPNTYTSLYCFSGEGHIDVKRNQDIVAFGMTWEDTLKSPSVMLVHPRGHPPRAAAAGNWKPRMIILPGLDQQGRNGSWEKYARDNQITCIYSPTNIGTRADEQFTAIKTKCFDNSQRQSQ